MLSINPKRLGKSLAMVIMMISLSVIVLSVCVFASSMPDQQDVSVLEPGKTMDGPGFFGSRIIRIDGNVEGTTFAAGQDVQINGNINGDLFVTGQSIQIKGKVTGNIYCVGQDLTFTGQNTGDVFIAGQNIRIDKMAVIGRDLFTAGKSTTIEGAVQRDFRGAGSDILINGSIGRNTELDGERIVVQEMAIMNGNMNYRSEAQATVAPASKISGRTDWTKVDRTPEKTKTLMGTMTAKLISIASALLVWFLIRIWKPDFWSKTSALISNQPVKTLGTGAIALIVTPLLIVLIMITVIGVPVGILLGIAYAVCLYLSKIVAAVFIGSLFVKRFAWPEIHKGVWLVLLGLTIITVLGMIPILGFLVWLLIVFAGLGVFIVSNYRTQPSLSE